MKKRDEAIEKSKKLFHLTTSFVSTLPNIYFIDGQAVILLLNDNSVLFEDQLELALQSWEKVMKLYQNSTFDLGWKKQVLAF